VASGGIAGLARRALPRGAGAIGGGARPSGWPSAGAVSARAFAHPAFWAGVLLLLLNDHVLKRAFPSFWTGKLSDFAGLFITPFLVIPVVAGLLRPLRIPLARAADLGCGLVGLGFAALKLSPAFNAAAAAAASIALGRPAAFALDPTDTVACLALLPARLFWGWAARAAAQGRRPSPGWARAGWALAMIALLATSPAPPIVMVRRVMVQEGRIYIGVTYHDPYPPKETSIPIIGWLESFDGGAHWRSVAKPPPDFPREAAVSPWPVLRCRPDGSGICYRIPGPGRIEVSTDAGRTWRVAWTPPWGRAAFRARWRALSGVIPFGCTPGQVDEGPYDIAFDPGSGRWIAAMGTEGILILGPEGSSQMQAVMSEPGTGGFRGTFCPTPYWADHFLQGIWITQGEGMFLLAVAALSYLFWSRRAIRQLAALPSPPSPGSPPAARRAEASFLPTLRLPAGCRDFGIGFGLGLLIILLMGLLVLSMPTLDSMNPGMLLVFVLPLIYVIILSQLSLGPLAVLLWLLLVVSGIEALRIRSAWRRLEEAAPDPEAVRAARRELRWAALGIFPGAWGFFIAWAVGRIPLYEMATALALGMTLGMWVLILRRGWR